MKKTPLTDGEHCAIMNRYREWKSMAKVAKAYRISPATVHAHIQLHNRALKASEDLMCDRCFRAGDWWVSSDFVEVTEKRSEQDNGKTP